MAMFSRKNSSTFGGQDNPLNGIYSMSSRSVVLSNNSSENYNGSDLYGSYINQIRCLIDENQINGNNFNCDEKNQWFLGEERKRRTNEFGASFGSQCAESQKKQNNQIEAKIATIQDVNANNSYQLNSIHPIYNGNGFTEHKESSSESCESSEESSSSSDESSNSDNGSNYSRKNENWISPVVPILPTNKTTNFTALKGSSLSDSSESENDEHNQSFKQNVFDDSLSYIKELNLSHASSGSEIEILLPTSFTPLSPLRMSPVHSIENQYQSNNEIVETSNDITERALIKDIQFKADKASSSSSSSSASSTSNSSSYSTSSSEDEDNHGIINDFKSKSLSNLEVSQKDDDENLKNDSVSGLSSLESYCEESENSQKASKQTILSDLNAITLPKFSAKNPQKKNVAQRNFKKSKIKSREFVDESFSSSSDDDKPLSERRISTKSSKNSKKRDLLPRQHVLNGHDDSADDSKIQKNKKTILRKILGHQKKRENNIFTPGQTVITYKSRSFQSSDLNLSNESNFKKDDNKKPPIILRINKKTMTCTLVGYDDPNSSVNCNNCTKPQTYQPVKLEVKNSPVKKNCNKETIMMDLFGESPEKICDNHVKTKAVISFSVESDFKKTNIDLQFEKTAEKKHEHNNYKINGQSNGLLDTGIINDGKVDNYKPIRTEDLRKSHKLKGAEIKNDLKNEIDLKNSSNLKRTSNLEGYKDSGNGIKSKYYHMMLSSENLFKPDEVKTVTVNKNISEKSQKYTKIENNSSLVMSKVSSKIVKEQFYEKQHCEENKQTIINEDRKKSEAYRKVKLPLNTRRSKESQVQSVAKEVVKQYKKMEAQELCKYTLNRTSLVPKELGDDCSKYKNSRDSESQFVSQEHMKPIEAAKRRDCSPLNNKNQKPKRQRSGDVHNRILNCFRNFKQSRKY